MMRSLLNMINLHHWPSSNAPNDAMPPGGRECELKKKDDSMLTGQLCGIHRHLLWHCEWRNDAHKLMSGSHVRRLQRRRRRQHQSPPRQE